MRLRGFLSLIPLVLVLAAPARAQLFADSDTLDRILPLIRSEHPGRLSDAEPWTDESGRTHYRIKWMTPEGRILFFDADAHTGRYLSVGGGTRLLRDGVRGAASAPPIPEDRSRHHDNFDSGPDGWPNGGDWRGGRGDWRLGHGLGDNGGWRHHEHGGH